MLPSYLPKDCQVELHSEIGIIGCGGYPTKEEVDPDLVNASKETCTVYPGASYMPSSGSFAVVRGGHLQMTALGGMQVSKTGDLAN